MKYSGLSRTGNYVFLRLGYFSHNLVSVKPLEIKSYSHTGDFYSGRTCSEIDGIEYSLIEMSILKGSKRSKVTKRALNHNS
jgi:hypothetical protein